MTREERVGIVIPTFNTGKLVAEAARSASQGLGSMDNVIVVDDGSTDRMTLAVVAELEESGYRILRQRNRGVSAARNAGLQLLDVPYAFALDSDDLIAADAPTIAAEIFDRDSDVAIVTGSGVEFAPDGYRSQPIPPPGLPTRESMMRLGSQIATASAFRVADWANSGGFPESVHIGEDWVFWMRLLRDGRRVAVADSTFVYRRFHPGQVTQAYVDPRENAKAKNLVMFENRDLALKEPDELLDELARLRLLLAEYRHAYRHADRLKTRVKTLLARNRSTGAD